MALSLVRNVYLIFQFAKTRMTSKTVLITGCSKGIGLEFVKYYVAQGWTVIATARNPAKSQELQNTGASIIETLDVSNEDSITALVSRLQNQQLDLLINNAGIAIFDTLETATKDDILNQFMTNSVAPFLLTRALLPNLKQSIQNPFVVNITSRMGSIADNTSGKNYGYRASKTAINSLSKSLSVDLKQFNIGIALVHPGFVQSNMTLGKGDITAEESVQRMATLIHSMDLSKSGAFFHSNGEELPW